MLNSHIILAAAWIIYCFFHSLLASVTIKEYVKRSWGSQFKYYSLYYTLFAFLGFALLIYFLLTLLSWRVFPTNIYTMIFGGVFTSFGGMIVISCIRKYFFQLSGLGTLKKETRSNELMITGIHKYVRHPLYSGTFVFIWGLWLLIPSAALGISNFIITVYTLIGIRFEEKKLELEFGEAYRTYQKEVPMIIPRF
jgi:methanethiol S-methyltransferase